MNDLIKNISRLHTTELGIKRIRRNLCFESDDVVEWCREKIMSKDAVIERKGKNFYITAGIFRFTVNAGSFTIITAHTVRS